MNKIILVFITLFIISCANSTTRPNTNIDIGDGTVIDEIIVEKPPVADDIITDPVKISDYLKKYSGRYYLETIDKNNITNRTIKVIVENGIVYDEKVSQKFGVKTLFLNKLQIEIIGNELSGDINEKNSRVEVFDFYDTYMTTSVKKVYNKESFSTSQGQLVGTISEIKTYSGSYYIWVNELNNISKKYLFSINEQGEIYADASIKNLNPEFSLKNNILIMKYTEGAKKIEKNYILKGDRIVEGSILINDVINNELETLKRSDLLTDYVGEYYANSVTLYIENNYVYIGTKLPNGGYSYINGTALLQGNELIMYQYENNSTSNNKEHKIVFSKNKKIAVYYDPHTLKTINLIRKERSK
ncbi:hypothetical protein R4L75_03090 [Brachyspira pilosicoli]|uniref:hypothetical protein n=1 Tax=Brachyspira pilosicoli TaxID=52584 RepID=UPI0030071E6F